MTDLSGTPPSPPLPPDVLRPLRWSTAVAWISWLLSIGLLWVEDWLWIIHPPSLLFVILLIITFGAVVTSVVLGIWRLRYKARRRAVLAWTLSALLPVLLWGSLGVYAHRNGQMRYQPHNLPMNLMTRVGHNLMEAQAVYLYPHRLETERLVMFYGDGVADPEGDIQAMDRHVARLEELIGRPLRAKIYWTRGRLLGQGPVCVYGIVIGSEESPAGSLDRHELAHAVETQHDSARRDHPTLLGEGWAESQSVNGVELSERAVWYRQFITETGQNWGRLPDSKRAQILSRLVEPQGHERLLHTVWQNGPAVCYLRELTDSFWYNRHNGPVYSIGGAFVEFLVRSFGAERFIEFYFATRPGTLESDCQRVYGSDLENLEKAFWADAEQRTAKRGHER